MLTEIHESLSRKRWGQVRQLLEESPLRGKQRAPGKKTCLHLAVEFLAPIDIIQKLLEIDPKAIKWKTSKTQGGKMALHLLMENINACNPDVFELLIKLYPGATKFRNAKGYLPLHIAVLKKAKKPVFEVLVKKNPYACDMKTRNTKQYALSLAAELDTELSIRKLLWENMDSDWIVDAIEGHLWDEVLSSLKKNPGRMKTVRKKDGKTPLHIAIMHDAPEKILLKMIELHKGKATFKACTVMGQLPLHVACIKQKTTLPVLHALCKANSESIAALDARKDIPLHVAIKNNMPTDFIAHLVSYAPESIEYTTERGEKAIHIAIQSQAHLSTVRFFMEVDPAMDKLVSELKRRFFPKWDPTVPRTKLDRTILRGMTPGGAIDTQKVHAWAKAYKKQEDDRLAMRKQDGKTKWYPALQRRQKTVDVANMLPSVRPPGGESEGKKKKQDTLCVCKYDYIPRGEGELKLSKGGKVHLLPQDPTKEVKKGWALGRSKSGQEGIFPISCVVMPEIENEVTAPRVNRKIEDESMLHAAARWGHVRILQLLLDRGEDLKAVNKNKDTPLHLASLNGHVDCVKILMNANNKESIDWRNKDDETPEDLAEIGDDGDDWPLILNLYRRYKMVGWVA